MKNDQPISATQWNSRWKKADLALFSILCLWAVWRFIGLCNGYWVYTVDDAFITLRQARNLVEGLGFVYNPGGPRVESYTNHLLFLWQVITLALGGNGLFWTKLLGIFSGLATMAGSTFIGWLAIRRFREATTWLPLSGLAAIPLLFSHSPALTTASVAGLETSLFAALVTWGGACMILLLCRETHDRTALLAGTLLGLATWTRPEGIVWLAGFSVAVGFFRFREKSPLRPVLIAAATGAAFWLALTIWRLAIFGHPFPNTYYAKMGQPLLTRLGAGLGYIRDYLLPNYGLAYFAAAIIGLLAADKTSSRVFTICLAAALGGTVLAWAEGGDWIPHLRLLTPMMGILGGVAVAGIIVMAGRIPRCGWALAATIPFVFWFSLEKATYPAFARAAAEIQTRIYGWNDAHAPLGKWLGEWNEQREMRGQPPLVVAVEDIGLIGWFSRSPIYDLAGLADPEWAHLHYSDSELSYPAERLLRERQPDIVIVVSQSGHRETPLVITWDTNRVIYEHPGFLENYSEVTMFTHKDFPRDGYFVHVFAKKELLVEAPPVTPPKPRAVGGV